MKINKIICTPIKFPDRHCCQGETSIQKAYRSGYGEVQIMLPMLIVQLYTDEGIIGIGDSGAVTSLCYLPDTTPGMIEAIIEYFSPFILGEDPFNIEKIMMTIDQTRGNHQAKAALDFALHDIVGKALNIPVYQLIGGLTVDRIPLSWVASAGKQDEVVQEALGAVKAGFKAIKLKAGFGTIEEDIENIKAVREAVGNNIKLGIDVNGGWHLQKALTICKKLEKFDIFDLEQPTPYWDVHALVNLRQKTNIPITADESAYGLAELYELLKADAVDYLFMKIPKAGGLLKARMWSALTKAAGIPLIVGEKSGGIGLAAAVHFACSNQWATACDVEHQMGPGTGWGHGSYELGPNIKDDYVIQLPTMKDGYIYPPKGPGLGVELNIEMLEKYRSGPNVEKAI